MADPYGTEEEQIRAIKQWWDENGSSTLIGVGLAIAIVSGWNWWQQHEQDQAGSAALLFHQLDQAVALAAEDDVQRATAEHLAQTLQAEHGKSHYNQYGQLLLARVLVEQDDLARAEAVLRDLQTETSDVEIAQLSTLRLARVQFSAGKSEEALKTVSTADPGAFPGQYAELRGDIHVSRDDRDAAIAAYQEAAALQSGGPQGAGLLRIKLEGLQSTAQVAAVDNQSSTAISAEAAEQ